MKGNLKGALVYLGDDIRVSSGSFEDNGYTALGSQILGLVSNRSSFILLGINVAHFSVPE